MLKQPTELYLSWAHVLLNFELEFKRRRTGVLVLLCPFHEEKTASLHCWPSGNFRCHGCGARGDIVDFVQDFIKHPDVFHLLSKISHYNVSFDCILFDLKNRHS